MTQSDGEVAVEAAAAGAEIVRSRFGTDLVRHPKEGDDLATDVDIAAEMAIRQVIHAARPADAVLGEETGLSGADSGRTWLVDPLCGTRNFVVGTTGVGVNVALRGPHGVQAAAVADPFSGEILWTDAAPARRRDGGRDRLATPSAASTLVDVNLDPPFPSAPGFRAVDLMAHDGFAARYRPRVLSSSLALAWVASGRRAAYVTDGDLGDSVHFAAGIAVCRAAGCVLTGLDGQPWTSRARGLVAAADLETSAHLIGLIGDVTTG